MVVIKCIPIESRCHSLIQRSQSPARRPYTETLPLIFGRSVKIVEIAIFCQPDRYIGILALPDGVYMRLGIRRVAIGMK